LCHASEWGECDGEPVSVPAVRLLDDQWPVFSVFDGAPSREAIEGSLRVEPM